MDFLFKIMREKDSQRKKEVKEGEGKERKKGREVEYHYKHNILHQIHLKKFLLNQT